MKKKLVLIITTLICCCMTVSATSFLEIHFSIKNLSDNDLILEYELNNEFEFWGRETISFYDENNNRIKADFFKCNPSKQYILIPNKIYNFFHYMKDTETEKIPFINRFNQVFKEFKIIDEYGNTVLEKEDLTNESFSRIDNRAIHYILEIYDKEEN